MIDDLPEYRKDFVIGSLIKKKTPIDGNDMKNNNLHIMLKTPGGHHNSVVLNPKCEEKLFFS